MTLAAGDRAGDQRPFTEEYAAILGDNEVDIREVAWRVRHQPTVHT